MQLNFNLSDKQIIRENEKWFKFFVYSPIIVAIVWAVSFLAIGIVGALVYDEMLGLFALGALLAPLVYMYVKVSCSYKILHIYYLKKISNENRTMIVPQEQNAQGNSNSANNTPVNHIKEEGMILAKPLNPNNNVTNINTEDKSSKKLKSVYIESFVSSIGQHVFKGDSTLGSVTIHDGVIKIGCGAFEDCAFLVSVIIGKSVVKLGAKVFNGCTSLTNLIFKGTVVQWNAIEKGENWNENVPATQIICSDGKVTL